MEDDRKALKYKNFDERCLQLIENFVKEFDELFGKYVSREEVLMRINKNLDRITFNELKDLAGQYNGEKREIKLMDFHGSEIESEEELKSVFFHEMIHCITNNVEKGITGFSIDYSCEELKYIYIVTCHGLTEGFTQFVTEIRDRKNWPNKQGSVYPVLTELVENLIEIIGEEEFFDIAFNRPETISDVLGFEGGEANIFYEAFEEIWKNEKKISRAKTLEGQFLKAITGGYNTTSENLKDAKNIILEDLNRLLLRREINTIEEFQSAYDKICGCAKLLDIELNSYLVSDLLTQVYVLQEKGITLDEILNGCNEELRNIVSTHQFVTNFELLDAEEKIKLLADPNFEKELREIGIYEIPFYKEYFSIMSQSIMPIDSQERRVILFEMLKNGLAKNIIEKGYNIGQLSIEFIDFELKNDMSVFNLYNYTGERTLLGTYMETHYSSVDVKELVLCNELEREKLERIYPELREFVLLTSMAHGNQIVAHNAAEEYMLVSYRRPYREKIPCNNIVYYQSELERLERRLDMQMAKFQTIKKVDLPAFLFETASYEINKIKKRIEKIKGKSKVLQEDVEESVGNISLEEFEKIMMDITKEEAKKPFDEGVEYDE